MVSRAAISTIIRLCGRLLSVLIFLLLPHLSCSCSQKIHQGWKACRSPKDPSQGCDESLMVLMNVKSLPTTALVVLLENKQIHGVEFGPDDMYYSTNLGLLPDISETGRDYYTLLYQLDIKAVNETAVSCQNGRIQVSRQALCLAGVNYRTKAWLDGKLLTEISRHKGVPGMFIRRSFDVTVGGRFNLLVEPPDHPGVPTAGKQGGNHALAQDGATAQYMLGWDWCQAMPDRATGFYGTTTLETTGSLAIVDPAIQTMQLECVMSECTYVRLRVLAQIQSRDKLYTVGEEDTVSLVIDSDWGESFRMDDVSLESDDVRFDIVIKEPEKIHLWWPHGLGVEAAHLHSFSFSLLTNDRLSDEKTIRVGIRTVETWLDKDMEGQRFRVNGQDIYLVGGNWIGTDQALRFSASKERYCNEIALHKHAGLNFLRVWGGGTAERDEFYDCADSLGLLVMQELWMTGDNNGRWAGNYSWPLDYGAYLANVEDTVRRLRRHASLLFYCGCNECLAPRTSSWAPNPPRLIDDGIRNLLKELDPGRFFISSSMGGVSIKIVLIQCFSFILIVTGSPPRRRTKQTRLWIPHYGRTEAIH